ncbi:MAG: BatD family protein [Myxococcota bacterium]
MRFAAVLSFLILSSCVAFDASAADAEVSVSLRAVPDEVRVGETFSLEVRADVKGGSLESLTLSDLRKYPEFEVVSHQTSRPMQVSFGFGRGMEVSSSLSHIYAMRALAPGTYDFTPAVAVVDGEKYESQALRIIVVDSGGSTSTRMAPTPGDTEESLSGASFNQEAFLQTVVEPEQAFLGQQVNVAVYLYTRVGVASRTVNPTKPKMDGFWVYDEPIQNLNGDLATVNGVRFRRYLLSDAAAFPQRTGTLTIGAPKVTFDTGGQSIFNSSVRVDRTGVNVDVEVQPLPAPGPADAFVGTVDLEASVDRDSVQTGNAVTLRVQASGVGNIQDLRISLPGIDGVRALQPAIKDQRRSLGGLLGGTRTWEWILIPETAGEHAVPSIVIPFFDPRTAEYGTAATEPMSFVSTGSAVTPQPPPQVDRLDAPPKTEFVFGPLRVYSALSRSATPLRKRFWVPTLLALPPAAFALLTIGIGFSRRRRRNQTTSEATQRKLLDQTREALRNQDPRAFYDGIVAAIGHAISARTGESTGGLSNAELRSTLSVAGFDEDLVGRVINELEGADFARFAASGVDADEMKRCLDRTSTLIERVRRSGRAR